MKGLSKKEIEIVSDLEFRKKYYFTNKDIAKFFKNETERRNIIYNLKKKGRIIKINRSKYYLIPIKARSGKWQDHPFIAIDEICNGKDYFIGVGRNPFQGCIIKIFESYHSFLHPISFVSILGEINPPNL